MKFFAEINEAYCEVNFYYFADDCDTSDCYCGKWMGYFAFELAGTDVTIYSWNLEQYDTRALRKAINFFGNGKGHSRFGKKNPSFLWKNCHSLMKEGEYNSIK